MSLVYSENEIRLYIVRTTSLWLFFSGPNGNELQFGQTKPYGTNKSEYTDTSMASHTQTSMSKNQTSLECTTTIVFLAISSCEYYDNDEKNDPEYHH